MSDKTGIEWTDATWNPIRGCSRVSEGCRNCYAEHTAARFSGKGKPYEGLATIKNVQRPDGSTLTTEYHWTGEVRLIESALDAPLRWKKPRMIFVNSMSDLFHPKVQPQWMMKIFEVMARANWHTFQVLTKRPATMLDFLTHRNDLNVLPNVWLGVSVEDRKTKFRIDWLRETPAAVRFLSIEPLLEEIGKLKLTGIHWVIVGGESGPCARPMHPDWARSVRDQCQAAGVPFFFKQWGEWMPCEIVNAGNRVFENQPTFRALHKWDAHTGSILCGKKRAGRLLDGREWNEFPAGHESPGTSSTQAASTARTRHQSPVTGSKP